MTPAEHLQTADPILARAIEIVGPLPEPEPTSDPFRALARIIVGQQLSTHVAGVIWRRCEEFLPDFTAPALLAAVEDDLRGLGLSRQKIGYLRSLAQHVQNDQLELARLGELSDDEVRAEVVAIKGLGAWSADIFLMSSLARPDILATGDLGLREAMRRLYNLEERPAPVAMEQIAHKWRPFRSLGCRYLWRWLDSGAELP